MYDYLTRQCKRFSKVIVSKQILLVKDGKILNEAMLKVIIFQVKLNHI
jgi:hypothetical protein